MVAADPTQSGQPSIDLELSPLPLSDTSNLGAGWWWWWWRVRGGIEVPLPGDEGVSHAPPSGGSDQGGEACFR